MAIIKAIKIETMIHDDLILVTCKDCGCQFLFKDERPLDCPFCRIKYLIEKKGGGNAKVG
jgi:hypothetical protein